MLAFIKIQNLANIRDITMHFNQSLCMFSGESGVGKSTIFDAIALLFGEKNTRYSPMKGEYIKITGEIDVDDILLETLNSIFVDHNMDDLIQDIREAKTFLLSRRIGADNRSRFFINGNPVSLTQIKEIANAAIEICSQNSQHDILNPKNHVDVLDGYAEISTNSLYASWNALKKAKKDLRNVLFNSDDRHSKKEYYADLIDEVAALYYSEKEEQSLLEERKELIAAYKARENLAKITKLLYEDEISLTQMMNAVAKIMSTSIPKRIAERFAAIKLEFDDFVTTLQRDVSCEEGVLQRIEDIDEKVGIIKRVARKYGVESNKLPELLSDARQNMESIERDADIIERAKAEVRKSEQDFIQISNVVSAERKKQAINFAHSVNQSIQDLSLGRIRLDVKIESAGIEAASHKGLDRVSFYITRSVDKRKWCKNDSYADEAKRCEEMSGEYTIDDAEKYFAKDMNCEKTNDSNSRKKSDVKGRGESYSLDTVSGGELSRLILAIKSVLSDKKSSKMMIFDEVDIGVSGAIASKVGQKLRSIAKSRVFVITHQPQVASYAQQHFLVIKRENGSDVIELDEGARSLEIARMLAGEDVSEEAIAAANVMLREAAQVIE